MTALGYLTTIVDDPEIVQQYLDTVRTLLRSHDNYTVRGYSTQLLRDSLGEDALPDLIVALDDEDHHVRGRALNYIGELWKETPSEERRAQIREAAERMIKDPHASCRLRAAQVLEGIGDEAAIAVLLDAIPDRDEETHNTIIDILNRFNPNQSG
jgi:HEAT repeat protein